MAQKKPNRTKTAQTYRLSQEAAVELEDRARITGKNKTTTLEDALLFNRQFNEEAESVLARLAEKHALKRRKVLEVMPTADAWLSHAKKRGSRLPIPQITRRRSIRRVAEALGMPGWPQDILRHTCASYWLAKAQDCGRVAFELGNSPGILMRHYMQLVSREAADQFWGIRPDGCRS